MMEKLTYTRVCVGFFRVKDGKEMKPEVSVFVPTYNHAAYIEKALDSILMQEVTFPYEIIIHDDASTDGTTEIIKRYQSKYPDIVKCRYQTENQYRLGNMSATWDCMFDMCTAKYCAELEGDDYWTDEKKLQRQYDYMESHPGCTLYIHNAWRLDVRTGKKELLNTFSRSGCYPQREQVLCGLGSKYPATASYFWVMKYIRELFPRYAIETGVGDYSIRQVLANQGTVYYDERPMSVYRYMSNGSFMQNIHDRQEAYIDYTIKMSRFYQRFNGYLDYQFNDIYTKKIDSDILGLAGATYDSREKLPDIEEEWFAQRLRGCYKMLAGEPWRERLKKKLSETEHTSVWIYGTSTLAAICKRTLEQNGICVSGFVVSDGYSKPDAFEGYIVKYLSETKGQNCFYIAAAQPINQDSIEQVLLANGETRYFFPYQMMEVDD